MNFKYLFKALRFACLPTLSVLVLLFFAFFDIGKTIAFISSDNAAAIILRICLVLAEIALIIIMYNEYEKKDLIENPWNHIKSKRPSSLTYTTYVSDLRGDWARSDNYEAFGTSDDDYILVHRKPKDI